MTVAVYPGSFDPVHYGHIDIAKRAAALFDHLIVAVFDRPQKNVLFTVEERLGMWREALKDVPNAEARAYGILTVDFVRQMNASVIVRGLRVISDFEVEIQMAFITRKLAPDIDMVCLMTSLEYAFISSSIVKEVARAGGPVNEFVPPQVERALRTRLSPEQ
ncbi:MAG: pantetheine-phosphate adenylyltransferase [Anaerolineae bacterium]